MASLVQDPTPRTSWLDSARGIGIILVVLGHVGQGLISSHILSFERWDPFNFALYTFHMPLFMFLAGLNIPRSLSTGGGRFVRSKFLTLMVPYVLWSLLQGLAMAGFSGVTNHSTGVAELLRIPWDPIAPFWFFFALFLFCIAARFLPLRVFIALALLAFPAGELFFRNSFGHRLLHFPLFFAVGMLFGSRSGVPKIPVSVWLASVCMAAGTVAAGLHAGMRNYDSVLMLPAAVAGTVVLLGVAQACDKVPFLLWTGRISLAIYVMHILAAAGMRIVLQHALKIPLNASVYVFVCTAAGVVLPGCVYEIGRRTAILPWLGLQVGPHGRYWIDTGALYAKRITVWRTS